MTSSFQLPSYSREEATSLLKALRIYRVLLKQIWKRANTQFQNNGNSTYIVEYATNLDIGHIKAFVEGIFAQYYNEKPSFDAITFRENPHLLGWLRFFIGDEMVDVSYEHIETMMLLSVK